MLFFVYIHKVSEYTILIGKKYICNFLYSENFKAQRNKIVTRTVVRIVCFWLKCIAYSLVNGGFNWL